MNDSINYNAPATHSKIEQPITKEVAYKILQLKLDADNGDIQAQYELGNIYLLGEIVVQDLESAFYWYSKAVSCGDAQSEYCLGIIFLLLKEHEYAHYWLVRAADQGIEMAQFNLGVMYERGDGVAKNMNKACSLYAQAAEQGSEQAAQALQNMTGHIEEIVFGKH